jgi:hypothetical protein
MSNLLSLPFGFWISLALVFGVAINAWRHREEGWGIPAIAVCATVCVWYHGDALYNDYHNYVAQFSFEAMAAAWWEVALFTLTFAVIAPLLHRKLNPARIGGTSTIIGLVRSSDAMSRLQRPLKMIFGPVALVWLTLSAVALIRVGFDWRGLFAPWLGHLAQPWSRGRIGGGFDFAISLVAYTNIFCLATFGVVAGLAKSNGLRNAALIFVALSWPSVFLDRTRHVMLAILLPGLLCFVFLRLRGRPLTQVFLLVAGFLAVNSWFIFVMAHRSTDSIAAAFARHDERDTKTATHEGLNMFEELCWINKFLKDGSYAPNWGGRYFAEAVNAIPRTLWTNKPTIGLDYAVARGQATAGTIGTAGATISTGMIGQGVVNFGPWGGPPAAALLMSAWVVLLARFDLTGHRFGRLPLYMLGLALTFNLGRDITFLVAFPLVFGYLIIRFAESYIGSPSDLRSLGSRSTNRP